MKYKLTSVTEIETKVLSEWFMKAFSEFSPSEKKIFSMNSKGFTVDGMSCYFEHSEHRVMNGLALRLVNRIAELSLEDTDGSNDMSIVTVNGKGNDIVVIRNLQPKVVEPEIEKEPVKPKVKSKPKPKMTEKQKKVKARRISKRTAKPKHSMRSKK